ncbi:uncharacterized protein LOC116256686 [Nymphaea colorata]|nr:uncharacterized protein LOC116256686 [Nymphaea colorata]
MVKNIGVPMLFFFSLVLASFSLCNGTTKNVARIYEIKRGDFSVRITNWGATVVSVILPDSKGELADVVLGFDELSSYFNDTTYFGATVGRVANRIKGAQFTLNGTHYKLVPNEGNNMLHGGHRGFSRVVWSLKSKREGEYPALTFSYHSFDGEQGFPGDVDVDVTYQIVGDYMLSVVMRAQPRNKATPVNLAQHTYWNLGGQNSGTILSNRVKIYSSSYTPVDAELIPTGQILSVSNTPYDFRHSTAVGERIHEAQGGGYDLNYVLDSHPNKHGLSRAATVHDPRSGRVLELWTTAPGLQFYTSGKLKDVVGKGGYVYEPYDGLCLETQGFPDSVNHPNFPSQIVEPGQVYKHKMLFRFRVSNGRSY